MGGATNCTETPRQKMIGMMYLVLTAMLAMNVSASILEGFTMVENSLHVNIKGTEKRNVNLYGKFNDLNGSNPVKVGKWLKLANSVKSESDILFEKIEQLKIQLVEAADGKSRLEEFGVYKKKTLDDYDIEAKSNLDAGSRICLDKPDGLGQGIVIKTAIDKYRNFLISQVKDDQAKVAQLKKTFNTDKFKNHNGDVVKWEIATFDMMPIVAITTIMTKIQSDIRSAEGETVNYLKSKVDAEDFRVNKIEALVIPNSKYVIQGGKYEAKIVLAASDSTEKPQVYVGGTLVPDGKYERSASSIGDQKFAGYIKVKRASGEMSYPFESDFTVGAPSATISADKMNVFYCGIDNDVSVSVPGVASSSVTATMSGGSLVKKPNGGYVARPAKVGQECIITAVAKIDGKDQKMGTRSFRVKMLPPPIAFIPYKDDNGVNMKYKGSEKIPKRYLLNLTNLEAELNDADIEAEFKVLSFEVNATNSMGAIIMSSSGSNFTPAQVSYVKTLSKGKKFFIGQVRAIGPDKIERKLPPMEVIVD